jgi:predicted alpha/beta-hydrolase family hydrolase
MSTEVMIDGRLNGIVSGGGKAGTAIVCHGSGRGMDAALLVKTAQRLSDLGFLVLRFNFGYLGKRPAPSAGGKAELPELFAAMDWLAAHAAAAGVAPSAPVLIGKSFGARVCANAAVAATEPNGRPVKACVFYGMPLQGMSKSSKPRDWSHLARITAPMLFITGDRDTLCPLDQLSSVLAPLTAPHDSEIVPGDHSYKPKSEDRAAELCTNWVVKYSHTRV